MGIERSSLLIIHSRQNHALSPTHGNLKRIDWTNREKRKNAMTLFGKGMGVTFFSALFPHIHLILVPLFFSITIYITRQKLKEKCYNLGGTGVCPKCAKEFKVQACEMIEKFFDTCEHCKEEVIISEISSQID